VLEIKSWNGIGERFLPSQFFHPISLLNTTSKSINKIIIIIIAKIITIVEHKGDIHGFYVLEDFF
jgi:hypothetical protein